MTKAEEQTIRNIISKLQLPDCGCSHGTQSEEARARLRATDAGLEIVSRTYLNTWVIGALDALLPETRNLKLALSLSR